MYGWMGTILRVNLTNGEITKEQLDEELAHKYIGGRGLNIKFLYNELKPGTEPLGPDNSVIFGVGPGCGTLVPSSQRWTVSAKSPLSGFIGDANCGSAFGAGLKYAGYDMLIIEGKSDRPLYLLIDDDNVQLRDAAHLWGKTTTETTRAIKREVSDPDVHIACIGPAGENLIRFASVISENRAAGKSGIGAVLGSKKLKAIAARGSKGVKVANLEMVQKVTREQYENWRRNVSKLKIYQEIGPGLGQFIGYNERGIVGTKNYQEGPFEGFDSISGERIKEYWLKPRSCFSCPVACNHVYIVSEGPYAGTFGEGLYAPGQQYTARIGNRDIGLMFKLAALSDQYGIDEMNMASIFGYVMECYEAGILTASDLDGLQMEWGNAQAILELMNMVVYRKGIGNLLAEGATRASRVIGKGSERYVMEVKGLSIDSRDPRGSKGWALGYAVASRGAEHCRYITPDWSIPGYPEESWWKEEIRGFKGFNPLSEEGKAEMYKWYEDVRGFQHSLETCMFALLSPDVTWSKVLAEMYNGVTGLDISASEVKIVGERINNLERAFNIREGLTRKDDTLPDRFLKEPMPNGPTKGQVVKLDAMIDEYYELRGWDKDTGFPGREKLEQLGLKEVADDIL